MNASKADSTASPFSIWRGVGGAALLVLTALNFVNYIDRSVLFAVQPLIQHEFRRSDAEFGLLTSAFFIFYMCTAPLIGPLADRYPRRLIMVAGAVLWSGATLLTAVTYDFSTLLIRHTLVGIGEATFVTIAPAYIADFFSSGTAAGCCRSSIWRFRLGRRWDIWPAAISAALRMARAVLRGSHPGIPAGRIDFHPAGAGARLADHIVGSLERDTFWSVAQPGFWTCSLGMAMLTFAIGGMQVWMPTFLFRVRGIPLADANRVFGLMTLASGIFATLLGGWLGDALLRYTRGAYYLVSAIATW